MEDKLNKDLPTSSYSNIDALIDDKLLRMNLSSIRKSKNMSQKKLAEISGLSESCISNIESGESVSPTLRSIIKYTNALGISIYFKYDDINKE